MNKLTDNINGDKNLIDFISFVKTELEKTEQDLENLNSINDSFFKDFFNFTLERFKSDFLDFDKLKNLFTSYILKSEATVEELTLICSHQQKSVNEYIFEFTDNNFITKNLIAIFNNYYLELNLTILDILKDKRFNLSDKKHKDRQITEERACSIVQSNYNIVLVSAPDGQLIEESSGWNEFTGQSLEEMLGWGWLNQIHNDDVENVKSFWLKNHETKEISEIECKLRKVDNKYSYVIARYIPIFFDDGSIKEWIGTITDITDNKISEYKILEENKINETLYRVGMLISAELDIEKLIQSVTYECKSLIEAEFAVFLYNISENENTYILYTSSGIPREEYKDFILPPNTEIFNYTFSEGHILRLDDVREDSRYGYLQQQSETDIKSYMAVPVISISGDIIGGLFFGNSKSHFFTERDEKVVSGIVSQTAVAIDNASLYQKTNEAVAQFSLLTDTVPEIIWTADSDGYKDYFNNNWYKYTGLDFDMSKGWKWKNIVHPDDVKESIERWLQSISTGEIYESIYRKKSKDGIYHWFLVRALPLKDDEGKIIKWFGTSTDIDSQKKTEEELERSNMELQQFAFISSHDLQEPLRVVTSYIQLLSKKYKDQISEEADEFINFAVEGISRMQSLIDDLQVYSNIIQKNIKYSMVDLEDILIRAKNNIKDQIKNSDAIITNDNLPIIYADESQILLLFQNLLSNSIKYCIKQPKIHISVELKYGEWLFSLKDNGIGIEEEYFDKIFLIFQRLHNRSKYQGTGMGLAICKKIVEKHKGNIWVKSEFNEGSIFSFTIPATSLKS